MLTAFEIPPQDIAQSKQLVAQTASNRFRTAMYIINEPNPTIYEGGNPSQYVTQHYPPPSVGLRSFPFSFPRGS